MHILIDNTLLTPLDLAAARREVAIRESSAAYSRWSNLRATARARFVAANPQASVVDAEAAADAAEGVAEAHAAAQVARQEEQAAVAAWQAVR